MSNVHQQVNRGSKPLQLQVTLGFKCSEKSKKITEEEGSRLLP